MQDQDVSFKQTFSTKWIPALIPGIASLINGYFSRKQEAEIQEKNRILQVSLEKNQQHFQLQLNEQNAEMQKQLSILNHELRLQEQQTNFEQQCQLAEWNLFLNSWPLITPPDVIRKGQILADNTVSLRVIFTRSNDPIFSQYVYPQVEQGLRDFIDLYHNKFASKNIIFYQNAFKGDTVGGAIETNIHYALKELPVIIIDTNILALSKEVCVSFALWGFGSTEMSHFTALRIPYQEQTKKDRHFFEYYKALSANILAGLKFILGYVYDVYNLIEYNKAPLLPKVAAYELTLGIDGCIRQELKDHLVMGQKYDEIYSRVLGSVEIGDNRPFALHPESFKRCVLHQLRMEYAEALKEWITEDKYVQYLDDSMDAWVSLRSTAPAEKFLRSLYSGTLKIMRFFNEEDEQYFGQISTLYAKSKTAGKYGSIVSSIYNKIMDTVMGACFSKNSPIQNSTEAYEPVYDPYDNIYYYPTSRWDGARKRPSEIEIKKYHLSCEANQYIHDERYKEAGETKLQLARICREQGEERSAYLLEHGAYECLQMDIFQKAGFPFKNLNGVVLCVEILKRTLTEMAEQALRDCNYSENIFCMEWNEKLCRTQEKEKDAYILHCAIEKNRKAYSDLLEPVNEQTIYKQLAKRYVRLTD